MKRAAQIAVSALLMALALYLLDWAKLAAALRRVHTAPFVLAVALAESTFAVMAARWCLLVEAIAPIPRLQHWRIYFYATFLNSFTPANIGGDVYRAVALKRYVVGMVDLVVVLLRERLLGLLSYLGGYCLLLCAALVAGQVYPALFFTAAIAVCGILLGIAAFRLFLPWCMHQSWFNRLSTSGKIFFRLFEALYFGNAYTFGAGLALSMIALAIWILTVKVVATAVGLALPLTLLGMIVVLTELIRLVPISFQGIGVRELTFSYLAQLTGTEAETAFLVGTLAYIVLSLSLVLSGGIAWLLSFISRDAIKRSP